MAVYFILYFKATQKKKKPLLLYAMTTLQKL